jgi:hypothetical protein
MKKNLAVEIISFLLILLFAYAATVKLLDFHKFRIELSKSPLLTAYSTIYAAIIPFVEIILTVLLSIARFRLIGLYASFSIMVMFTTYIIIILNFSEFIPCSCGGVLQNMSWKQHLIFNIFYIFLALIGILIFPPKNLIKSMPRTSN